MPPTNRAPARLDAKTVLTVLARSPAPVEKRRLAKILGLKGPARDALKILLRNMLRGGQIVPAGDGRIAVARAALAPGLKMVAVEAIDIEDGTPLVRPTEWNGEAPLVRLIVPLGHTAPAIGAHGLVEFSAQDGAYSATLVRLVEPVVERLVGQLAPGSGGTFRLAPTDRRIKSEFVVDLDALNGAVAGDLVLAEILPARRLGLPKAKVVERIGQLGDPRSASLIAIFSQDIPTEFPADALQQAERAKPATLDHREDLRGCPIVTIDGADARDFDDAVMAEPDPSPDNPGGFKLTVAIADVAWYVRGDDALDRSAYRRGNSCYFPDRVVPMLPERLSNDLCSLRPDEDRPVLAVHIVIGADGKKRAHHFVRATIRSAKRFTYETIQAIADGHEKAPDWIHNKVVVPLYAAYRLLDAAKRERGALDLDVAERKVEIGADGKIASIKPRLRLDSHKLIEEFMILANVCAAETLERAKLPCMYRVHEPPAPERVDGLREVLDGLGFNLARGAAIRPHDFGRVLAWAADKVERPLVSQMILRCQSLAVYAPNNLGHFGLALARYAHFTSPIRRYADLLVHRALISAGKLGDGGLMGDKPPPDFKVAGEHISATERRAVAAERDAMARYVAAYLMDREGAQFSARVSGVQKFGLFVTLDELGADGLVPVRSLPQDFYNFDERRHTLTGNRTGRTYQLGQAVEVRLREAEKLTASLVFEIMDSGGGNIRRPPPRHIPKSNKRRRR